MNFSKMLALNLMPPLIKRIFTISNPTAWGAGYFGRQTLAERVDTLSQLPGFCDTSVPASSGAMQTLIDTLYHHRLLEAMSDASDLCRF